MSYFVYILKSEANGNIYIGSTEDMKRRLKRHNAGFVKSTKAYCPWILLEHRMCTSRSEAVKLEMFLKTGQQKEALRKKYGGMAKHYQ